MTERCEWNPALMKLSSEPPAEGDCPNDSELSVGAYGEYHLCASCAKLPTFNRFKVRTALPVRKRAERK